MKESDPRKRLQIDAKTAVKKRDHTPRVTNCQAAALLARGQQRMRGYEDRINVARWALKIGLGVGPIITGVDKYFNMLADWGMYLNPLATKILRVNVSTFMHVVGFIEIIAGLIVLSRWTKIGGYIVMFWLLGIALNLISSGMFYDLAMRDMEIALGAFVLSQLTEAREQHATVKPHEMNASNSQFA